MKPYNHPAIQPSSNRTIKEETRYFLKCRGYTATDQEIQRAMWRERKYSRSLNGWCIYSYLMHNNIAKPIEQRTPTKSIKS